MDPTAMKNVEFPLTKLPCVAHRHALSTMSIGEIITYSLLSKKCNLLVKSLHLNTEELLVNLGDRQIKMNIGYGLELVQLKFNDEGDVLKMPKPIMVTLESIRLDLKKPEFNFRDWLDYFMEIFNSKSIILVFSHEKFSFPQYKMMFQGLLVEDLRCFNKDAPSYDTILDEYPMVKYFTVNTVEVTDQTVQRPLVRLQLERGPLQTDFSKFKALNLDFQYPIFGEIINDVINIMIHDLESKTESVSFVVERRYLPKNVIPAIMDGIDYQEAPKDQVRRFYRDFDKSYFRGWPEFKGGIDFERKDGVKMTLIYKEVVIHIHFVIMFWH